jgi:hypothetical protein
VEQELFTLPEHLSSLPDFSGVYIAQSFVFCVIFFLLYFYVENGGLTSELIIQ